MRLTQYFWVVVLLIALAVGILPAYSQQSVPSSAGFQVSTFGALEGICE